MSRNCDKKSFHSPLDIEMDVERQKEDFLNFDETSGEFLDYSVFKDKVTNKSKYGWEDSDSRRFTERRKKTVRFDGYDGSQTFPRIVGHHRDPLSNNRESHIVHNWATVRWDCDRQGSQDSATKDSGIDTSSNFTSSEDSNRGDGPKVFKNTIARCDKIDRLYHQFKNIRLLYIWICINSSLYYYLFFLQHIK